MTLIYFLVEKMLQFLITVVPKPHMERNRISNRLSSGGYRAYCTLILWFIAVAVASAHDNEPHDYEEPKLLSRSGYLRTLAEPYQHKLDEFVQIAGQGDIEAVRKMFSRIALNRIGDTSFSDYISTDILPFFSSHEYTHSVSAMNPAGSLGGVSGYWFDSYSVDEKGKIRPFSVVIISEGESYAVANILVNQCRPHRHPFCPQGYTRR